MRQIDQENCILLDEIHTKTINNIEKNFLNMIEEETNDSDDGNKYKRPVSD